MAAEPFGTKVKGMNVQGATDAEFFKVTELVFQRLFRSPANYLMPIPQTEINKNEALVQNPGY
ncbi:SusD family protein [compost metagenome]